VRSLGILSEALLAEGVPGMVDSTIAHESSTARRAVFSGRRSGETHRKDPGTPDDYFAMCRELERRLARGGSGVRPRRVQLRVRLEAVLH